MMEEFVLRYNLVRVLDMVALQKYIHTVATCCVLPLIVYKQSTSQANVAGPSQHLLSFSS